MNNIWQGKKVRLRAVELSDVEDYFCNEEDIDTDGQRTGDRVYFPVSRKTMEERALELAKSSPLGEEYFMIIEDLEGNIVGNINSHSCNRINGTFQYGVSIRSTCRGKGYASEAIRLLIRYYFLELGYQKVETHVYGFNNSSIRLHEKLGFVLEGTLRRHHYAAGKWHNVHCYGMTREEFEDKNKDMI